MTHNESQYMYYYSAVICIPERWIEDHGRGSTKLSSQSCVEKITLKNLNSK